MVKMTKKSKSKKDLIKFIDHIISTPPKYSRAEKDLMRAWWVYVDAESEKQVTEAEWNLRFDIAKFLGQTEDIIWANAGQSFSFEESINKDSEDDRITWEEADPYKKAIYIDKQLPKIEVLESKSGEKYILVKA